MGFVIVHLSDIHLSNSKPSNPILDRIDGLCGSIRSMLDPSDNCALVLSGDIADFGKVEEYDLAVDFIKKIYDETADHLQSTPQIVIVPGNHDLDFELPGFNESIRDLIIDKCGPQNLPDKAMHEYCLKPQQSYRDFADNISDTLPAFAIRDLMDTQISDFDNISVQFHLLNTTRFSRKNEIPSSTWFPVGTLANHLEQNAKTGVVTVGVAHHPYNWFLLQNANELKRILESHCDIVLTGHEHHPDQYKKSRRTTEQNLYVEGGLLQDHNNPDNSSFNVVRVEPDRKIFFCWTFAWTGTAYEPLTDRYEHRYLRLRRPLLSEFEVQKEWETWLEQVGTDFNHPRCRTLNLRDLFIYPDLQRLDVRMSCTPTGIVRDRDVVGFIQEKKRVLIAGAEKTGKTCFAKQLFTDLREAGYVPLLIRADFKIKKLDNATAHEKIRGALNKVCQNIYAPKSAARFWHTKIAERALIIDDYHRLPVATQGRDKLLHWFDENFGLVVLFSEPGMRMAEILSRTAGDMLQWTFEHVDILECDAESRYGLIRNWLLAGTDPFDVSSDDLYHNTVRYGQIIDAIIGQGAIPSLPLFILMMMQQLETRGSVVNTTGLYGYLYELIIRDVVKTVARDYPDLEVKLNYLTEFAFELHSRKKRFLDNSEFRDWHTEYCRTYHCRLIDEQMILQFETIGVFRKHEASVGFKYRYYYCFFLARYFANKIHEQHVIDEISEMCSILYNDDATNTMLFLCHLSKDPKILKMILASAKEHFKKVDEYNLSTTPRVLPDGAIQPANLVLPPDDPEQERLKALRKQDEILRPHGLEEVQDDQEDAQLDDMMSLFNEANSAVHSIMICGQVIRNFYGGMTGKDQVEVIRECYGLCLRMMSVLFDVLETNKETIASLIAQIIQHRYPTMSDDEVNTKTRRSLQFIALTICYGLVKHCSNSVGLSALEPSFDELMSGEGIGLSHRMLDLSARLDYFEAFPESSVLGLASDLDKGLIGYEVLRVLVWEHFKLFRRDFRIRQRVCTKLNIDASQAPLLGSKDKKLPSGKTERDILK